jgi:hypothetical protein
VPTDNYHPLQEAIHLHVRTIRVALPMTDPGLDQRLRQRSRRAGLMIGISMAMTIALCVAGFSVIYAALDDTIGDFVSRDVPTAVIRVTEPAETTPDIAEEEPPPEEPAEDVIEPPATEAPQPTSEAPDAATDGSFTPDFQSSFEANLNFRSEPSTSGGGDTVIQTLPAGTELQSTGETQASDNPAVDGEDGWIQFELEDGTEGWLRAIDVTPIEP